MILLTFCRHGDDDDNTLANSKIAYCTVKKNDHGLQNNQK